MKAFGPLVAGPWVAAPVSVLAALAAAAPAPAHPAWSVVHDPQRGLVFYSDLRQVWQVDRAGQRAVAVPEVHTHELRLDEEGNLYGEDLENLPDDRWRHRVWRRSPAGTVADLIPWREGFRDDYGFVADSAGVLYWASCQAAGPHCVVKRRRGDEVSVAAGGARFGRPLNFLADDRSGGIFVADGGDVKRITSAGTLEVAVAALSREDGRFGLMGLQVSEDGSLYAAAHEDRAIVRVDPDGRRTVVARTKRPWQPTGVLAVGGDLWVLEFHLGKTRLRYARSDGLERVYGPDE